MTFAYLSPFANHLWQSTLCALVAWLLTLTLRRNRAALRYWLWLAASAKFLIPFVLLVSAGSQLGWRTAPAVAQPGLSSVMDEIGQPFAAKPPAVRLAGEVPASNVFPEILLGVWLCGFAATFVSWFRRWRHIRAVQRAATPLSLNLPIEVLSSSARLEPGVFGILRPVLLLPDGITDRLTPLQLEAVIAHELCHVRRRDNLTATIHMVVEAIYWFHPLVWWIRERLVEERERACDEEVLRVVSEPEIYAEGILNVCRFYIASPLTSVSGVTGANLKLRIAAIIENRTSVSLNFGRKLLLASVAIAAVAGPIAIGILYARPSRAQALSETQAETAPPTFEAASVKANRGTGRRDRTRSIEPGRITYMDTTLGEFIAMAYGVKRYQISGPGWIVNLSSSDTYDVIATAGKAASVAEVKRMLGPLLADRFHLAFHRETRELPVLALLLARGGPRFKEPGDGNAPSISPDGEGGLSFKNWSMESMADWLTLLPSVGHPVVDHTGLAGSFSFHANLFNLEKGTPPDEMKRAMVNSDASDILRTTLPEQLGLKLESQRASIEMLVIDHADKVPVEN
jgi:bla regulator protein blaR1